jgi:hypothetical protein
VTRAVGHSFGAYSVSSHLTDSGAEGWHVNPCFPMFYTVFSSSTYWQWGSRFNLWRYVSHACRVRVGEGTDHIPILRGFFFVIFISSNCVPAGGKLLSSESRSYIGSGQISQIPSFIPVVGSTNWVTHLDFFFKNLPHTLRIGIGARQDLFRGSCLKRYAAGFPTSVVYDVPLVIITDTIRPSNIIILRSEIIP